MDQLLSRHPLSNYSSYQEFIRDLIQDGISRHGLTFDQLNYELYKLNREIYQEYIKQVLTETELTRYVHTSR